MYAWCQLYRCFSLLTISYHTFVHVIFFFLLNITCCKIAPHSKLILNRDKVESEPIALRLNLNSHQQRRANSLFQALLQQIPAVLLFLLLAL